MVLKWHSKRLSPNVNLMSHINYEKQGFRNVSLSGGLDDNTRDNFGLELNGHIPDKDGAGHGTLGYRFPCR